MTARRRILVLGAGAGIAALAGLAVFPGGFDGQTLTPDQAHSAAVAGTLTLIDIRRPDEWALTGVGEGATPLDMRDPGFEAALARIVGNDLAAPVALICARGVRSARLAARLQRAGHTRIIDVPEGMLGSGAGPGWIARGLPVRPG
jgi:rhodanese-related sulfurtransferase